MPKIVTHDASFHTDDVFAVATLLLAHPDQEFEIIRSRDREIIDQGDFVVDVGSVYDPSKNRFDHHQEGGAGKRENGISYASFGLVWKEYDLKLCGSIEVAKRIEVKLVMGVDAYDNGINLYTPLFDGVYPYVIENLFHSLIPLETSPEELYKTFIESVTLAKSLLKREIGKEKKFESQRNEIEQAYTANQDRKVIILEKNYERILFRQVLSKYEEPVFVVYPSSEGRGWKVEVIPEKDQETKARKSLPVSWRGSSKEEYEKSTGVPGTMFVHNGLFLAVHENKEGAIELANKAINS